MKPHDPFISNEAASLYFWHHTETGGRKVQFSNKPHELLPHHCERHGWWSDVACREMHGAEQMRLPMERKRRAA